MDYVITQFKQGSYSLLAPQSIQTPARNAAANKQSHTEAQKVRVIALKP
jgi:hypothetical protein